MRIGIMTFWQSQENYGQLLQAFALQSYLKKIGHEPFIIKFHRVFPPAPKKSVLERIRNFSLSRFINNRKRTIALAKEPKLRGFDQFRKEQISFSEQDYYSFQDLKDNPPKADAYICGSDQVWNNTFKVPCEPFLLGFGHIETKRIAYAASFGQTTLSKETEAVFKKYLPTFNAVGIREKGGLELCKKTLECNKAVWTPDPTLLFDKSNWIHLLDLKEIPKNGRNNILLYTLGNSPIKNRNLYIQHIRSLSDVQINHVTANKDFGGNAFPDLKGWVNLIATSDFILTNSFHGMVFCIIFNRNFVILPNTGTIVGMNDRIVSLLERAGLDSQIMFDYDKAKLDSLITQKIDWQSVNNNIAQWRKEAEAFLSAALLNEVENKV